VPLRVICVRGEDGELLGAAPYYATRYVLGRLLPYRVLRVIGDVDSGAEYQAWIAHAPRAREVCAAIAAALHTLRAEWDLIWMPKLDAWSAAHDPMLDALRAGGFLLNHRPRAFSAVALPGDYESYLAKMSANRRQQVRRLSNKIFARPGVEIRRVVSKDELDGALAALFRLHDARWRSIGQEGVFARSPKEREFYERFVPQAFEQGWLSMYVLWDGGEPKAVQIGYIYKGALLHLQEGFDPGYVANVGNALRAHVIQDCIAQGVHEYDFLGGLSEHKRRWLAEERVGMDLLAAAPRLKNALIMNARVWPTGAFLRPRAA
jgi:CelD/BcsL family acetyltransferase involved in cellulose biosynthesis